MKLTLKHDLSLDIAKKVAVFALKSYSMKFAKYSPTTNWTSEKRCAVTFNVKGISIDGALDLVPGAIELELDVPFLLRPFQSRALGLVEAEIRAWIARAKSGEF